MGFVLYLGLRALDDVIKRDCDNKLTHAIEEFRGKLEDVVELGMPTKIDFRPPKCFKGQRIKIEEISDEALCSAICEAASPQCLSITVSAIGPTKRFCLRTTLKTRFPEVYDVCEDKSSEGYTLLDLRDEMPEGHYYLINRTPAKQTFPVICAYYKK
jgi:hypothetical protein